MQDEPYYSKEQAEALHRLRDAAGGRRFDAAWAELIAAIRDEMNRGGDPRDAPSRDLARRWKALVDTFTGGRSDVEHLLYEAADKFQARNEAAATPVPNVLGYMRAAMESVPE